VGHTLGHRGCAASASAIASWSAGDIALRWMYIPTPITCRHEHAKSCESQQGLESAEASV